MNHVWKQLPQEDCKSYLGICRSSDIMLSNSFQNVTSEASVKDPGAISHKVFSQVVTMLKKKKKGKDNFYCWAEMNNVGKFHLLPHHFSPTCLCAPLPVHLCASAQLLSTPLLPCQKLMFVNTHSHTLWDFLTLSGLVLMI